MPTSFLDLPREIRDMIYSLVLISPTEHLLIKLHKSRPARQTRKSATGIRLQPCQPRTGSPLPSSSPHAPPTTFQQICRQTDSETQDWLWARNTIVFSSPSDVIEIFKHMGQRPSRLIQKAHVVFDNWWDTPTGDLMRALSMFASRTRQGKLSDVGVVLREDKKAVSGLCYWLARKMEDQTFRLDDGLSNIRFALGLGKNLGWAKNQVKHYLFLEWNKIEKFCLEHAMAEPLEEICKHLYYSWGGKLVRNGVLIWDNHVRVGPVPDGA